MKVQKGSLLMQTPPVRDFLFRTYASSAIASSAVTGFVPKHFCICSSAPSCVPTRKVLVASVTTYVA